MDKIHNVKNISFDCDFMLLTVDGKDYRIDLKKNSKKLTRATLAQKQDFEVSPSGYGIHWPELDEDLSVDGLIGVKHSPHLIKSTA